MWGTKSHGKKPVIMRVCAMLWDCGTNFYKLLIETCIYTSLYILLYIGGIYAKKSPTVPHVSFNAGLQCFFSPTFTPTSTTPILILHHQIHLPRRKCLSVVSGQHILQGFCLFSSLWSYFFPLSLSIHFP